MSSLKFLSCSLAVFALLAANSSIAFARPLPFADVRSLAALQVKYIGGDNDALFFDIKYDNKRGRDFKLVVLDETGEALFEDSFSKGLDKKLKVPRLTDSQHVIFLIKSPQLDTELSYKVRVTTKVVDDASYVTN